MCRLSKSKVAMVLAICLGVPVKYVNGSCKSGYACIQFDKATPAYNRETGVAVFSKSNEDDSIVKQDGPANYVRYHIEPSDPAVQLRGNRACIKPDHWPTYLKIQKKRKKDFQTFDSGFVDAGTLFIAPAASCSAGLICPKIMGKITGGKPVRGTRCSARRTPHFRIHKEDMLKWLDNKTGYYTNFILTVQK